MNNHYFLNAGFHLVNVDIMNAQGLVNRFSWTRHCAKCFIFIEP